MRTVNKLNMLMWFILHFFCKLTYFCTYSLIIATTTAQLRGKRTADFIDIQLWPISNSWSNQTYFQIFHTAVKEEVPHNLLHNFFNYITTAFIMAANVSYFTPVCILWWALTTNGKTHLPRFAEENVICLWLKFDQRLL